MKLEDLHIYQTAMKIGEKVWDIVNDWEYFQKKSIGMQLVRAADSIAANISEGYGRYHYQENIQFCRQARGSIYELIDDFNECADEGYLDQKMLNDYKEAGYYLLKVLNKYISSLIKLKQATKELTH